MLCGGFADEKRAKKMRQDDGAEFISASLIALTSFFFSSCFDSAGRSSEHEYVVILLLFKSKGRSSFCPVASLKIRIPCSSPRALRAYPVSTKTLGFGNFFAPSVLIKETSATNIKDRSIFSKITRAISGEPERSCVSLSKLIGKFNSSTESLQIELFQKEG